MLGGSLLIVLSGTGIRIVDVGVIFLLVGACEVARISDLFLLVECLPYTVCFELSVFISSQLRSTASKLMMLMSLPSGALVLALTPLSFLL